MKYTRRNPNIAGPNEAFLGQASICFAAVCCVLTLWLMLSGSIALNERNINVANMPHELTFTVPETGKLTQIRIDSDVREGWAFVEAFVTDPDDHPVPPQGCR